MKINPVLRKEVKLTVRSFKTPLMIAIFAAAVALVSIVAFEIIINESRHSAIDLQSFIGVYIAIIIIEAILLMFIVPSLAATAISGERERQTLDILLSTKMSPLSIIIGKLTSSIGKVLLLIVSTIPMISLVFIYGGVEVIHVFQIVGFFMITTIFVGSIGVLISTTFKTSKASTAMTYGVVFFIIIGLTILTYFYFMLNYEYFNRAQAPSLPFWSYINPAIGLGSILMNQIGGFRIPIQGIDNAWIINIIVQIVFSILCVVLAACKLNPLKRRRNKTKKVKK